VSSLKVRVGVRMRNLVEKFGWMKFLFWLNLVLAGLVIWLIWFGFGHNSVENCWNQYQTEVEAILHCEGSDG